MPCVFYRRDWLHRQPSSVDSFADALHKQGKPSVAEVSNSETQTTPATTSSETQSDCTGLIFFDLRSHLSIDRKLNQRQRAARLHAEEAELFQRKAAVLAAQTVAEDPHVVSRAALQRLRAARLHEEEKSLYAMDATIKSVMYSGVTNGGADGSGADVETSFTEDTDENHSMCSVYSSAPVVSVFIPGLISSSLSGGDDGTDLHPFMDPIRAALQKKRAKRLYDEEVQLEERAAVCGNSSEGGWKGVNQPTHLSSLVPTTFANPIRQRVQALRAQRLHAEERQLYDMDKNTSIS